MDMTEPPKEVCTCLIEREDSKLPRVYNSGEIQALVDRLPKLEIDEGGADEEGEQDVDSDNDDDDDDDNEEEEEVCNADDPMGLFLGAVKGLRDCEDMVPKVKRFCGGTNIKSLEDANIEGSGADCMVWLDERSVIWKKSRGNGPRMLTRRHLLDALRKPVSTHF
jgi:hypothetical protein